MNVWSLARNCVAAFIIVLTGTSAVAQNPGNGNYPFARFDSFGFDSINPGDLNVHFVIPIVSKAGRVYRSSIRSRTMGSFGPRLR